MPWFRMRHDVADKECPDVPNLGGVVMHMKLPRGNGELGACRVCGFFAERLCDWIEVHLYRYTGDPWPDRALCSRPLCRYCTSSPAKDKDLCPEHDLMYRAWLAGRTNSTEGAGP